MSKGRLAWDSFVCGVAAFGICLLFGGCTTTQRESANQRLAVAETVAYAACKARRDAPIVQTALREALIDVVPYASLASGLVSGACGLVLMQDNLILLPTTPAPVAAPALVPPITPGAK